MLSSILRRCEHELLSSIPVGVQIVPLVAQSGGKAAKVDCEEIEKQIGHSVISRERAFDYLLPAEDAEVKEIE